MVQTTLMNWLLRGWIDVFSSGSSHWIIDRSEALCVCSAGRHDQSSVWEVGQGAAILVAQGNGSWWNNMKLVTAAAFCLELKKTCKLPSVTLLELQRCHRAQKLASDWNLAVSNFKWYVKYRSEKLWFISVDPIPLNPVFYHWTHTQDQSL